MEFHILGPVEVWDRERPVELRRRKHRALLAMLLLRRGEILSIDALVDGLWGEDAPRTATAALRNYVSQLRSALGAGIVSSHGGGYALDARPEQVDLCRFEGLVAEGRQASGENRVEKLRRALAVWRGPPLADVSFEPFAALEVGRLEDLRVAALEDAIDAELALGAGADLIRELESLIAQHAFRERLRGQLMLGLYRAGRQAEALEAYQETRRTLVAELGIEPSRPLRELEQAILRQDASLGPSSPPPAALPAVEERRKTVTVLFADLRSIGVADPELLHGMTAPALAEVRAVLEAHGAAIEQRAGDEVMAVFGVPLAHEDDVLRGARAAAELQRTVAARADVLERAGRGRIELRIAIATGEVLAGADAAGHGFITGPAMTLAKRLQQTALPGEILVNLTALGLLGDAVAVEPAGQARPDAARLLEVVEGASALTRHFEAALVGREVELEFLRAAFDRVASERRCRLLTIIGEAGIGKTRLANELISDLEGTTTVLVGRCVSYGKGASFLPLAEIIREARARTDFRSLLAADEHAELVTRKLAELTGDEEGAGSGGEAFWAARRFFEALAWEQPLALVFEDLHWAEPTLLDLIEHLVARAVDSPILVLGTARAELLDERSSWTEADALQLSPLPRPACETLIDNLADLERGLRKRIVRTAAGNPLFLEQLAAYAAEDPELELVPPSLEALLTSRLDLLASGELAVLQRAAVAGREFWRGAVVEQTPEDEAAAVGEHLDALARRGLIRPSRSALPQEEGYRFHHVLIRDVAYGTLTKTRRADLHERFARWLEARSTGLDELVGFHFEQAHRYLAELGADPGRARQLAEEAGAKLAAAGLRAWRRADVAATVNLLGRGAELLPPRDPARLELLCELGLALRTAGDIARANAVLEEATDEAAADGERRIELRARIELASSRLSSHPEGGADELLELATNAVPTFEALGDDRSLGRAWLLSGYVHGSLHCHNVEWREAAERALIHYRRSGWPTAACFGDIATSLYYGPTAVPEAVRHCEELLGEVADRAGEAHILVALGGLEAFQGRLDEGRRLIHRARTIYGELGYGVRHAAGCGAVLGELELLAGNPARAEQSLRAACEVLEAMQERALLASRAAELAQAIYVQQHYEEAERWTRVAEEHAASDDMGAQSLGRAVRAKILARQESLTAAEAVAREAVVISEQTDALNHCARVQLDLAEVLRRCAKFDEATEAVQRALDRFERKGNLVEAERTRTVLEESRLAGHPSP